MTLLKIQEMKQTDFSVAILLMNSESKSETIFELPSSRELSYLKKSDFLLKSPS